MKKINSIGYGGKIIAAAFTFLFPVPAIFHLLFQMEGQPALVSLKRISVLLGIAVLLVFSVLLAVEFYQDKKANRHYERNKNRRLPLKTGMYECQACGSVHVGPADKSCGTCGIAFKCGE